MQSIIGKGDIGSRRLSRNVISSEVEKSSLPCGYPCQCENENQRFLCFVSLLYHVGRLWVCQKDPSAALGMTKRGADGFSLVFRSLPSIRFLRCVPLQRVRSGEECLKDCGERSSRIVAEYNRKGGDIGSRRLSRNVISSEVEKSSLPCGYPCQCENENQRFLCFVSLLYHVGRLWVCQKDPSAALGMTKRGADGFSLVFRSLPFIRFLRCGPLQ